MSGQDDRQPLSHGVILRSKNGDVITYDSTGLIMRLSDKVVSDIGRRLDGQHKVGPTEAPSRNISGSSSGNADLLLDGVDAWDPVWDDAWLQFTARRPGLQGTRRFQRHRDGGAIVAAAPGPFIGFFTIGGPMAALANNCKNAFPHHVLASDDDIGAVGQGGEGTVEETAHLMELREQTHDALVAEALLRRQFEKHGALPLYMVRCETDSSPSVAALTDGPAITNLLADIANFGRAAANLGKRPKILAIGLDFVLEDVLSSASDYRDGVLAVMARIETELRVLGFGKPQFVMRVETTGPGTDAAAAIEGQWELVWNHSDHDLLVSAPGYMFERDAFGVPTEKARREMAEMTAAALSEASGWTCPTPHLAERFEDGISVKFQAATDLVVDESDPLRAGAASGFVLNGLENDAQLTSVQIDPNDQKAVLLKFDKKPEGKDLVICHACDTAANSAIRDQWTLTSGSGGVLHRWALPARLPVNEGGL